jgi:hypothetical protein
MAFYFIDTGLVCSIVLADLKLFTGESHGHRHACSG